MSYQIGIDALNLRPTPRLAHTEYCDHEPLRRAVTGIDIPSVERERLFMEKWDYDFIWSTNEGPEPWEKRGRTTDMGHAEFMEGGVDRREPKISPFHDVDEVLAFDAVSEYGYTDFTKLARYYQSSYDNARAAFPEQVFTGGYYQTVVSGAIAAFGWDLLLEAAAYTDRFTKVLDSIYLQTLHHVRAWAQTSCVWFMSHDDMVWSQGAFMRPSYYRAEIFPRYKALWKVLHDAGKKVIFTSDGDYSMFVDDIVEAGADALCFEPMMPLEPVVIKYGQSHPLLASMVDARTLTFGDRAAIKAEIDATLPLAMQCKGFIWAVGNHLPANIPVKNALFYMDYLREHWLR
ncbi:MAG: uroporphyrinogen decarboxylase family protein [Chloroflexi bacterium]|nr:uroporphyrinogen decarboxylase family protein [Chloroflexota bacterium]